jgi:GST-like protein
MHSGRAGRDPPWANRMLDLHYWPTPNGFKVTILLEECATPYRLVPVNISTGEQFRAEFLAISPNNRMPAIVDHAATGGPLAIFESGAILLYLAEKSGRFLAQDSRGRYDTLQWLFWQMAGLGPMSGQAGHFLNYAAEQVPYAIERYTREVNRLYGVMERRLQDRDYLAGDYSIADIACWPWVRLSERLRQDLAAFPRLARWYATIGARPAVQRGIAVGAELTQRSAPPEEARKVLFGQTAATCSART